MAKRRESGDSSGEKLGLHGAWAINSTLFATARLAHEVAEDGELPAVVDHHNDANVPDRAVATVGRPWILSHTATER